MAVTTTTTTKTTTTTTTMAMSTTKSAHQLQRALGALSPLRPANLCAKTSVCPVIVSVIFVCECICVPVSVIVSIFSLISSIIAPAIPSRRTRRTTWPPIIVPPQLEALENNFEKIKIFKTKFCGTPHHCAAPIRGSGRQF